MGVRLGAVAALLTAGGLGWALLSRASSSDGPRTSFRPAVELDATTPEDVVLEATLKSAGPLQPGQPIDVELALANRSKDRTHSVVLPGDGSRHGWREPHVFWTATQYSVDGRVDHAPFRDKVWMCGVFDEDWRRSVVPLAPGARLRLKQWTPTPWDTFDVQAPGRVGLVAHYVWSRRPPGHAKPGDPHHGLGAMDGIAPFELTSKPVMVEVVRPLDVVVTVKASARRKTPTRLSDLIDAVAVNRSDAPIRLSARDFSLTWKQQGSDDPRERRVGARAAPSPWIEPKSVDAVTSIDAGASTPLLGTGPFADGRDLQLEFEGRGTWHAALVLSGTTLGSAHIRSNWFDVSIEE
jgi:hypothetical protein